MSADGSIIINTKIDTGGFTKSASEMKTQFGGLAAAAKKLGAAIATAFSIGAIVQFGRESVNAASEMSSALRGLQSILEGQGRSFSAAQQFIKEYTQDGLIPAANAINAYKNLASRGYDDSQIRQVMIALKDASAFGRQASYSMGEAVQSATEGLRNENSVLVDNAGVTKNVAKMWDEYAASIGTTANNLTQQQKIQAEVNGILEESKYQAGDAAIVAGTFSGQLQRLAAAFKEIQVSVGQGLINALTPVLGVLNTILIGVQRVASAFAQLTSLIFGNAGSVSVGGTQEELAGIADGYEAAAGGADNFAGATEKAGKAAKKYLAGFDEITKLSSNAGGGGSAGGAAAGVGSISSGTTAGSAGPIEDNISPQVAALAEKIKALIAPLQNIDFTPLKISLSGLGESFGELGSTIGNALGWAWENILVPLAKWTIEDAAPAALDVLSAALGVLNEVLIALQPLGLWLWENFLKPIAEWTGGVIVDALDSLAAGLTDVSDWISQNQGLVQGATVTAAAFMAVWKATDLIMWIDAAGGIPGVLKLVTNALIGNTAAKIANKAQDIAIIAMYIGDYIKAFARLVVKLAANTAAWVANTAAKVASTAAEWAQIAATVAWNGICAAATAVTTAFGAAIAFLTSPIGLVVVAITALIAIVVLLVKNWDTVKEVAANVWKGIQNTWSSVSSWFKTKVLDPLANGFKGMVNGVIGFLNGLIRGIVSGVNTAIKAVNKLSFNVPDLIPGLGGKTFGFHLQTITAPQIPYLAKGAVIPPRAPFMAVLGDQPHGTNIEAPLDTIKQAVAEVVGDMVPAMMAGFEAVVAEQRETRGVIESIEIGDDTIGQSAARWVRRQNVIRGGSVW